MSTSDAAALRDTKLLLLEQLGGLRAQISTIHQRLHEGEARLHQLPGPLDSAAGQDLLREQQDLVQQWRTLLVAQQEVLRQYLDAQQRHADLGQALPPSEQPPADHDT